MKKYYPIILSALLFWACSDELKITADDEFQDVATLSHEMIVLGEKLNDPYSLENMQQAVAMLYPESKAGREGIRETDIYVRFLPRDSDEFDLLQGMGVELIDHPLDYEIVREGDYYHDPELDESQMTWQYAVVSHDFVFPASVRYEVLEKCYIPERDTGTKADGIDWTAVEREAYLLSGNEYLLEPEAKAKNSNCPSGNISIIDKKLGSEPIGVKGVKIAVNSFVKYSYTYTDENGDYTIPRNYSSAVRYRIVYKNEIGFAIGLNLLVTPASACTLGRNSSEGVSIIIDENSDRKMFSRSVVNNTAYEYFRMCEENALTAPPKNLRFWLFQKLDASSSVMMQHGAILDHALVSSFLGIAADLVSIFMPDITLGLSASGSYSSIYSTTCHELAHASHFQNVGSSFWNKYIVYILKSSILDGDMYGSGNRENAGCCEVGEMWAYFMEDLLYEERYEETNPGAWRTFWFNPRILRELNDKGINRGMIMLAMNAKATGKEILKDNLIDLYPDSKVLIEQTFNEFHYE